MKYELTIETQTSNTITVFPHTREGLIEAFNQVHIERSKTGFQFAKIVSYRDGEIFAFENDCVSA